MKSKWLLALGLIFCLCFGKTYAEFTSFEQAILKDSQSIRAVSMGNAYTALGEGVGALFYNPAGLSQQGALYSYQDLDNKDTYYDSNTVRYFYTSPFAISQQNAKNHNGDSINVTTVGYGKKGSSSLDWGISYKSIETNINNQSTTGVAASLGLMLHVFRNMNLGMMLQDGYTSSVEIPTTFKTGIALFNKNKEFIFTSDVVYQTNDQTSSYKLNSGLEYHLTDGLVVRGGYFDGNITSGLNFVFPFLELDYGVVLPQDTGDARHLLGVKLGRGLKSYQNRRRYTLFKPHSFAEFTIAGNLVEGKSEVSLLGGYKIGANDLLSMINESIEDKTCKGYIVSVRSLSSSLTSIALVQEVRAALKKAKLRGKKVYVYLDGWVTLPEYYLASIGDKIMMPELGTVSQLGLKLEITKATHFFDNFGLKETVVTGGEHKGNWHAQTGPLSSRQRYHTQDVLDQLYAMVLHDIQSDRSISENVIQRYFDGRVISAREAKTAGLVDDLGYYDDFLNSLVEGKDAESIKRESLAAFTSKPSSSLVGLNKIPVIEIDGVIKSGRSSTGFFFGGKSTGADDVEAQVEAILKTPFIRGVILRVNSPGGSMLAADKMFRAINKLKEANILVYASFGNMAASGGYYVSMNADKIIANETTLTGSIGVISSYLSYKGLQDMLGIDHEVFSTGKYMSLFSSNSEMTEDELFMLTQHQDEYYEVFVNKVRMSRHLTQSEVYDIAQGQVFTGKDAVKLKIVDEIGTYQDAIDALATELHMTYPDVVVLRKKGNGILEQNSSEYSVKLSLLKNFFKFPLTSFLAN